jgi:HD-GYP domain-containing protein (c-di-GMP phosphodiesterase class II)
MSVNAAGSEQRATEELTDELALLREVAQSPSVERAAQTVQDLLGMDVACSSQITDSEQIVSSVQGDRESFGLRPGTRFPPRDLQFLHAFARMIADILERESLVEEAHRLEIEAAALTTLVGAIDARDSYTGAHSRDVVEHAGAVAARLGLSDLEVTEVEQVALLHDVGKIAIPDRILCKPGPLTEEEWEVMRSHPVRGEQLVRETRALSHLASAVRAEHERWDGHGYPDGLAGGEIPIASRVTFVCDAYDAMTSDRPYRSALGATAARAELEAGVGSQFCPNSTSTFLSVLDEQE